jgi:hypothetical protein
MKRSRMLKMRPMHSTNREHDWRNNSPMLSRYRRDLVRSDRNSSATFATMMSRNQMAPNGSLAPITPRKRCIKFLLSV